MIVNFVKPNLRGAAYDIIEELAKRMGKNNYQIIYIDDVDITNPLQFLQLITTVANRVQKEIPKPDIWHVYDWKYFLPFMELEATVLWLHGVFKWGFKADVKEIALDGWEYFIMNYQDYAYKSATVVLVASNYIAQQLKYHFGNRKNIVITGLGVDEKKFYPMKCSKKYDIAMAAVYKKVKGIDRFIEIAKQLNLIDRAFIAGQEIPSMPDSGEITKMIKESGIRHGYLPTGEMPEFYNSTKIYIQPSTMETWGLAVTEAMSCGIPVVCSNIGGLKEQITNGVEGYLCNSTEEMIDRTKYLLENSDEAEQMGLNGRKKVLENYTLDKYFEKVKETYKSILDGGKS